MKPIPNFEGYYAITNTGVVHSLPREVIGKDGNTYKVKGRILATHINKDTGYPCFDCWKDGVGTRLAVHRVVAELYVPNPEGKPEVNHKDSVRTNSDYTNLEWVTSSENSLHAYAVGHASQKQKRKLSEEDYLVILDRFLNGEPFEVILRDYPICAGTLSRNIRKLCVKWDRLSEYNDEIYRQRCLRARSNGCR